MNILEVKSPLETIFITFDFTAMLAAGETLTGTAAIAASVYLGKDANPQAMLIGTPSKNITNTILSQQVTAGLAVTDYKFEASCATTAGRTLSSAAVLPVR